MTIKGRVRNLDREIPFRDVWFIAVTTGFLAGGAVLSAALLWSGSWGGSIALGIFAACVAALFGVCFWEWDRRCRNRPTSEEPAPRPVMNKRSLVEVSEPRQDVLFSRGGVEVKYNPDGEIRIDGARIPHSALAKCALAIKANKGRDRKISRPQFAIRDTSYTKLRNALVVGGEAVKQGKETHLTDKGIKWLFETIGQTPPELDPPIHSRRFVPAAPSVRSGTGTEQDATKGGA